MKKINSIGYGGKVIMIGSIFAFLLPFLIYIFPYKSSILLLVYRISMSLGIIILVCFAIWLTIELHQDKKLNEYYNKSKNQKLEIGENVYECQACGNRQLKVTDQFCHICGIKFK